MTELPRLVKALQIVTKKDNVHWYMASTQTAFKFDVIMLDLNDKSYDIHILDIYETEYLKNGTLKVPILDVQTTLKNMANCMIEKKSN